MKLTKEEIINICDRYVQTCREVQNKLSKNKERKIRIALTKVLESTCKPYTKITKFRCAHLVAWFGSRKTLSINKALNFFKVKIKQNFNYRLPKTFNGEMIKIIRSVS
jgi:hypothetical protein